MKNDSRFHYFGLCFLFLAFHFFHVTFAFFSITSYSFLVTIFLLKSCLGSLSLPMTFFFSFFLVFTSHSFLMTLHFFHHEKYQVIFKILVTWRRMRNHTNLPLKRIKTLRKNFFVKKNACINNLKKWNLALS